MADYKNSLKSSKKEHLQQKELQKQQLGLTENYQISRIGVNFGTNIEGDGKIFLRTKFQFSAQQAEQQIKILKETYEKIVNQEEDPTQNQQNQQQDPDFENSLAIIFKTNSNESAQKVQIALTKFFDHPANTDKSQLFGQKGMVLAGFLLLLREAGQVKIWIHKQDQTSVVLHFKGTETFQENVVDPLQMLIETGLGNISTDKNEIEFDIVTNNTFTDLLQKLKSGMTLGASITSSLSIAFKMIFQKDLADKLKTVLDQIDPDFNQSPPMQMLQLFKEIDIDYSFESLDELPKDIKSQIFEGSKKSKFYNMNFEDPNLQVNLSEGEISKVLVEELNSNFEIYINVPQLVAIQINGNLPNLVDLFKQIGKLLLQH